MDVKIIESINQFLGLAAIGDSESLEALRHYEASEFVWRQILELHPEHVRTVTLNRTLPDIILSHLATHESPDVRADIANRRTLPRDLYGILASDRDEAVRARLAWNKKTPVCVLKKLACDPEEIVFKNARLRLSQLNSEPAWEVPN